MAEKSSFKQVVIALGGQSTVVYSMHITTTPHVQL